MHGLRLAAAAFVGLSAASFAAMLLLRAPSGPATGPHAVLSDFVRALCEGRRADLRWLVTDECVPYVQHMQELGRAEGRGMPEILEIVIDGAEAIARVRERDSAGAATEGEFVLRREDGRWKVDLIATAGRGATQQTLPGGGYRVTQTGLDAKTRFEAARVMEARYRRLEQNKD